MGTPLLQPDVSRTSCWVFPASENEEVGFWTAGSQLEPSLIRLEEVCDQTGPSGLM